MLHRAATSAYSWWWASHVRTKQSKWLEQNLQDMEEKVQYMMKIIEQDGDSFAMRAEMYYRKRPELILTVEDSYRAYRALAERYDHLSKDLQSANRTIATVFPEQVQLAMETDDEDSMMGSSAPSPDRTSTKSTSPAPQNYPKAPKLPKPSLKGQTILASKRDQLRRNLTVAPIASRSGLSKEEAAIEVDIIQKDILSMQTEKEYMQSAYENALAKFIELESRITESEGRACALQDEFDIGTSIEDRDARSLMASSALKSCAEALAKLQEQQGRSMQEVKEEYERMKEAHKRLNALKKHRGHQESEEGKNPESKAFEETDVNIELEEAENADALRKKIREELKLTSDSSLTEPEISEKIDDLVEKMVKLETTICSQDALVKRLRHEIDELLGHTKILEEQKVEDSAVSDKLRELQVELVRVNGLNKAVVENKKKIYVQITEASCNLDHLTGKLHDEREVEEQKEETQDDMEKEKFAMELKSQEEIKEGEEEEEEEEDDDEEEEEEEKQDTLGRAESATDIDMQLEEKDGLNWRQLYMNNLEDREKILVEEYSVILQDYKGMKMKLSEIEKQHRDDTFDLKSQVKDSRDAIVAKDEEIKLLRKRLGLPGEQADSTDMGALNSDNDLERQPLFHHLYDRDAIIQQAADEHEQRALLMQAGGEKKVKINLVAKIMPDSRTEGRFRAELDSLLEANLDFWLRFSTAFHQIQKFQTSIRDLQADLVQLKGSQKKGGDDMPQNSGKSDARPLYMHLREIQTELTLWLESSTVFQEELKSRNSSLNNIQDQIVKVSDDSGKPNELSDYQAAKFQGEVLNMKQENSKVAEELQAGIHRVKSLKVDVEKVLAKLDKEYKFSETKSRNTTIKNPLNKPRIPLHSFLFGVKLKRHRKLGSQSLFSCVNSALPKEQKRLPELPE